MKKQFTKYGLTGRSGFIITKNGLIHISSHYGITRKDMCFVEYEFKDKDSEYSHLSWKRMTIKKALKDNCKIITCSKCNKYAVTIDHHFPYFDNYNMCKEHFEEFMVNKKSGITGSMLVNKDKINDK